MPSRVTVMVLALLSGTLGCTGLTDFDTSFMRSRDAGSRSSHLDVA